MFPVVSEFTMETKEMLMEVNLNAVLLFRNDDDKNSEYEKVFKKAAEMNQGKKFVFFTVGSADAASLWAAQDIRLTPRHFPTIIVQ